MAEKKVKNRGSNLLLQKIKAIRLLKGYSQEYMAEELGISQGDYSMLETGAIELSAERLFIIARIFLVDINYIADFELSRFTALQSSSLLYPQPLRFVPC